MGKLRGVLKVGKLVWANLDKIGQVIVLLEQLALIGKKIKNETPETFEVEGSDKVYRKT
jgi:hypothetical protein